MCSDPAVEGLERVKEEEGMVLEPPEAAQPSDVVIDDLIFSDGAFPSLPEFPCLSSPSPSSAASTQPKAPCLSNKSSSSSSSTSSSSPWSFLKVAEESDGVQMVPAGGEPAAGVVGPESEGIDFLGAIDLWESGEPADCWDTSSFFLGESCGGDGADGQAPVRDEVGVFGAGGEFPSEDLAKVFFEWLKSNKDSISPEDLRSIKLKRSTVECAASRLGGGKQGRVQLLKLILAWVQNHHLQKRRRRSRQVQAANQDFSAGAATASPFSYLRPLTFPPPPDPHIDYHDATPYNSYMPYAAEPPPPTFPAMIPAYHCQYYHEQPISPLPPPNFHSAEQAAVAWQPLPTPQFPAGFASHFAGCQPVYSSPSLSVARLPSATKEARKNRMARHRKLSSLHHNRAQQPQPQPQNEQSSDPAAVICDGSSSSAPSNIKSCRHWSSSPTVFPPPPAAEENLQRHALPVAEKRRVIILFNYAVFFSL
ncbi:B3 domain-containing protein VP1 [Platanthera guangdongensis]|uniref:B3 domain-containing protein VP1 n=1 Tax=Platanthera guangdongensis TaxID=2320717 RepID=A0ABR2N3Q0_9ASPA